MREGWKADPGHRPTSCAQSRTRSATDDPLSAPRMHMWSGHAHLQQPQEVVQHAILNQQLHLREREHRCRHLALRGEHQAGNARHSALFEPLQPPLPAPQPPRNAPPRPAPPHALTGVLRVERRRRKHSPSEYRTQLP